MMLKKVLPVLRTSTLAVTVGCTSQSTAAPTLSLECQTSFRLIQCTATERVTTWPRSTSPVPSAFSTPAAMSDATAGRYCTFPFDFTSRDRNTTASVCVPMAASRGTSTVSRTCRWLCAGMCSTRRDSDDHGAADCASEPAGLNTTAELVEIV